jgi:hypothetical protein
MCQYLGNGSGLVVSYTFVSRGKASAVKTISDGCFHCIGYIISHDNPWHMHTIRCKSRDNVQTRFITIRRRCLTVRRARNALHLDVSTTTSQLLRSEASEAKVGGGGYEGNDDHGQAEGQQELGEHVGSHCWGGVGVVRHGCESCFCYQDPRTVPDCL